MLSVFKPLFRFRKYIIAGEILNNIASSFIALVEEDPAKPKMFIEKPKSMYLGGIESCLPKYSKDELRLGAKILRDNKHAVIQESADFYQIHIVLTEAGIEAHHDGYYTSLAVKEVWKIIGISSGILLSLIAAIRWVLPLLQRLLEKG